MNKQIIFERTSIGFGIGIYLIYKLHDFFEPFAFGHARWTDAYVYWFGMMHLDFGLGMTFGLNVHGITDTFEPIYYLAHPPLIGLVQAIILYLFNGQFWAVRILPLLSNLMALCLTAWLANRWIGRRMIPYVVLLYLGAPFVIKYGSCNESYQVVAMSFALFGWMLYFRSLDSQKQGILWFVFCSFAIGLGFTWLSGFMAIPVFLHMLFTKREKKWKFKQLTIFGIILIAVVLAIMLQQGVASGDFFHPFRRALERAGTGREIQAEWGSLLRVQAYRFWAYFGPTVVILMGYWFLRRAIFPSKWTARDTWLLSIWCSGLIYGFLLRNAAMQHDFLLLGFTPGTVLAATAGANDLIEDGKAIFSHKGRPIAFFGYTVVMLLFAIHSIGAVRSAINFEAQEAEDLAGGGARVAFYLHNLTGNILLASDQSARLSDGATNGQRYGPLWPHLDYLVRRPVRAVNSSEDLDTLIREAQHKNSRIVLVRVMNFSSKKGKISVPSELVDSRNRFGETELILLKP